MCKTCPLEGSSHVFYTWTTNIKQKMNKQTKKNKTAELLMNFSQDVAGGLSQEADKLILISGFDVCLLKRYFKDLCGKNKKKKIAKKSKP